MGLQTPGCDGILGSNRTLDKCGVCGGDHATCKLVAGNYSEASVPIGYHRILQIPVGATQIQVREMARSPNYLGTSKTEGYSPVTPNYSHYSFAPCSLEARSSRFMGWGLLALLGWLGQKERPRSLGLGVG